MGGTVPRKLGSIRDAKPSKKESRSESLREKWGRLQFGRYVGRESYRPRPLYFGLWPATP
jgi:hypothetical protein